MVLSECVYKLVDIGLEESAKAAALFASQLPPGLVTLSHVQSVAATVPHRYASHEVRVTLLAFQSYCFTSFSCSYNLCTQSAIHRHAIIHILAYHTAYRGTSCMSCQV